MYIIIYKLIEGNHLTISIDAEQSRQSSIFIHDKEKEGTLLNKKKLILNIRSNNENHKHFPKMTQDIIPLFNTIFIFLDMAKNKRMK